MIATLGAALATAGALILAAALDSRMTVSLGSNRLALALSLTGGTQAEGTQRDAAGRPFVDGFSGERYGHRLGLNPLLELEDLEGRRVDETGDDRKCGQNDEGSLDQPR